MPSATIELATTPQAPRQAREGLATSASAWAADELLRADAALLINDVVSNAMDHVAGHDRIEIVTRWNGSSLWALDGGADPVRQLAGRTVLLAHGDQDRVTDPERSYSYALRARLPVRRSR